MAMKAFEIVEYDDAGNTISTYIQSSSGRDETMRVDVIPPKSSKSQWQQLLDIFLPVGYPHSVTEDYLEYQIYDSLQAFASSIASLLSSRAVLSSVGVGDSSASPTAALLLSILQESVGRVATILFAYRFGTALEPECKRYRLLADILNDVAFVLDCLSPALPKPLRIIVLSSSSVLRALCGVAAGSAKASLSAHFARWGNLGEVNAKDSSQETVVSLVGMLAGSVVVAWVTGPMATWTVLVALLACHLEANRRAVRAVAMRSLNRQRATLVFHSLARGEVPTPEEVAAQERIFETDGVLRDGRGQRIGECRIGASMPELLAGVGQRVNHAVDGNGTGHGLADVLKLYREQRYILWHAQPPVKEAPKVSAPPSFIVVLKKDATTLDVLMAWWQALILALDISTDHAGKGPSAHEEDGHRWSMETAQKLISKHREDLQEKGWDLSVGAMETRTEARVTIGPKS